MKQKSKNVIKELPLAFLNDEARERLGDIHHECGTFHVINLGSDSEEELSFPKEEDESEHERVA